jgi:hypothetical protein
MNKEFATKLEKATKEAQEKLLLRKEQETATKKAEELKQETEKQMLLEENKARLRATGVVTLFEMLRDSGIIRFTEEPIFERRTKRSFGGAEGGEKVKITDYTPAKIEWDDDNLGIKIEFDHKVTFGFFDTERVPGSGGWEPRYSTDCTLRARITKEGELQIGEHVIKQEEELNDVTINEILKLRGLKE